MYQHQRAPLPLEQVKGVPQPVVALLEVLLQKDPTLRLQNPAELLNALPKVTDAVKARRTITHESLRESADQRLGASEKAIAILTTLQDVFAARRVRLILWAALVLVIGGGAIRPMVPRVCLEIPIAKYQGEHPEMNAEFLAARNQVLRKVEGHPADATLPSALGLIDAYLGRKQDALQETKHAVEMLPVSKDAFHGPPLVVNLEIVYALTNEPDLAFQALYVSIRTPASGITYGQLKLDPRWDPLRTDPRFEKLLVQLAPKE